MDQIPPLPSHLSLHSLLANVPVSQVTWWLPLGYHGLRHQPIRSLYLIHAFFTLLFIRIPVWIILSLPRSNRSRRPWSNLDYRLSRSDPYPDRFPFPAALLDAIAVYSYLVNVVGFEAANVTVAGDSAGANLALSLIR
jgi:hypothetical protein